MKYQSSGNLQHSKVYIKVEFNIHKNQRGIFQKYKTKTKIRTCHRCRQQEENQDQ